MLDSAHPILGLPPALKHSVDAVVIAGIPLTFLDWPHMSGLYEFLGIIWVLIRIYETALVQRFVTRIRKWLK